jgi:hypothetical protein
LSGQALELVDIALVKLESSDTHKLAHCSDLQSVAIPVSLWLTITSLFSLLRPDHEWELIAVRRDIRD